MYDIFLFIFYSFKIEIPKKMQSKRKKKVSKVVAQSYLESIFILISIKFYSRGFTNAAIIMNCAIAHATSQKINATIRLRNAFLKNVASLWKEIKLVTLQMVSAKKLPKQCLLLLGNLAVQHMVKPKNSNVFANRNSHLSFFSINFLA
jgi:hypothetical protein